MNKKELLNKLSLEETRLQEELKQLKELLKVDLSNYEEKKPTKRIATHIMKNTNLKNVALEIDNIKLKIIIYSKINNLYNQNEISIYYNFNEEITFKNEMFKSQVSKYIESKISALKTIKHNINYIDKIIKDYNKLLDLEKEVSKKMSYIIKDEISFYSNYRNKIEV